MSPARSSRVPTAPGVPRPGPQAPPSQGRVDPHQLRCRSIGLAWQPWEVVSYPGRTVWRPEGPRGWHQARQQEEGASGIWASISWQLRSPSSRDGSQRHLAERFMDEKMTHLKDIDSDLRGGDGPPQDLGSQARALCGTCAPRSLSSHQGAARGAHGVVWPQSIKRQRSREDTECDLATLEPRSWSQPEP